MSPHIRLSEMSQFPQDLDSFDVVVSGNTRHSDTTMDRLTRFVHAGGGWHLFVDLSDRPLPEIFGVQPDPIGPAAELRILFEDTEHPLAARLPDAVYLQARRDFPGVMSVYIRELARELGKRRHWIDVYTRLQNGRHQPVIDLFENVRLIHLGIPDNGHLSRLALYPYLSKFFELMENFRSRQGIAYDLIHSHYWLSGRLGNWAQELWDRPHIAMLHTLGEVKNRTGVGRPESELRIAAEKKLLKTCHRILAPTDREKNSLMRYYGVCEEKIGVVPCGVNLELFQPQDKQAARKQLGFDPEDLILLYVGRFEPLKGIEGLLEAVSHLKRHRRLRLVLVGGDGDEAPESRLLQKKAKDLGIEDKVLFAGRVDQKYLPPYYSSADVLVISSHYESFGLVGLEALACGRPVVSTAVGAMETLIKQSQAGHILRDRLPRSLAMGILAIITNSNPPRSNEIRKAVLKYSWSNVAAAILREYEIVIGQRVFENDRNVQIMAGDNFGMFESFKLLDQPAPGSGVKS